jgi:HAD superfamily hydrolase (TIGR01549 family)
MTVDKEIRAVIWDFDGTLGDTGEKNLRVTHEIVARITGRSAAEFLALRSVESYLAAQKRRANWREFYSSDLGLTEEQTDEAGRLWTEYQLRDGTPTPVYRGIHEVVNTLQSIPHGIVSQNAKSQIKQALETVDLLRHFRCIVGYEEVGLRKQKPAPDGLLLCIEELTGFAPGYVFYIGDHEVDVETALNANRVFGQRRLDVQVITIAAVHAHVDKHEWNLQPNYIAENPVEIINIVQSFAKP